MIEKDTVCIMESAEILGDVKIGKHSSIWSKVVIRGDESPITIGRLTNIQDMSVIHAEKNIPMEIGDKVTIGHSSVIHCRKIGSDCMVGMGALILNNVEIGEYSIIAAGAVVPENTKVPPRSVVMGIPGRIARKVTNEDIERIKNAAMDYRRLSRKHFHGEYKKVM